MAAEKGSLEQRRQEQPLANDEGTITSIRRRRRLCPHQRRCLPQELIELILRHTSLWASARLRLVSKAWAAVSRAAMASHCTPWILLSKYDVRSWSTRGYLVSISGDGAAFEVRLPWNFYNVMFIGACDGWIAFADRGSLQPTLVNPFTMSQIRLPGFPWHREDYRLLAVVKCLPSMAAPAADGCCMIASVRNHVALWHPDHPTWEWRTLHGWHDKHIVSIAAFKGKFYALDGREGSVYVVDFLSMTMTPLKAPGLPLPASSDLVQLVESQGELLLVHCESARLKGVYRLDPSKEEWVVVKSLGKHRALFVGSSTWTCPSSMSVKRAFGCKGDCVYLLEAGAGPRWTVFDMADGSRKTLESTPRPLATQQMYRVAWVLPNLG